MPSALPIKFGASFLQVPLDFSGAFKGWKKLIKSSNSALSLGYGNRKKSQSQVCFLPLTALLITQCNRNGLCFYVRLPFDSWEFLDFSSMKQEISGKADITNKKRHP